MGLMIIKAKNLLIINFDLSQELLLAELLSGSLWKMDIFSSFYAFQIFWGAFHTREVKQNLLGDAQRCTVS